MRKLIALILIFSFLGQTFNQGWYYLGYLLEKKDYMARCVNKARPQLHCNGQCVLMKRMEERRKKEQGLPPEMKMAAKVDVISSRSFFPTPCESIVITVQDKFYTYTIGTPVDRPSFFFHPPNCV